MTKLRLVPQTPCPKITLSSHSRYRMDQMRLGLTDVVAALADAEIEYSQDFDDNPRRVVIGRDLRIVLAQESDHVITVIWRDDFVSRVRPTPIAA